MARRSRRTMASVFGDFLKTIFRGQPARSRRPQRRSFVLESLEARAMLASDFAAITGLIYRDATGDGFTAGEEVAGATVNLYTDDGDGVFEPAGDDAPATADVTAADGRYRFDGLSAGSYWIEQPAQDLGGVLLSAQNSSLITISALEAQGIAGTTIDDYTDTGPSVSAAGPAPSSEFDFVSAPAALGGERDLLVALVSGVAGEDVQLNGTAGALTFSASSAAVGRYVSVWDGADNDGNAIAFIGLSGQDFTSGGATAIRMIIGADLAGATARLRVYTDADHWSEQSLAIAAGAPSELIFLFSGFAEGGGSGPADFSDVGAIELQIDAPAAGSDGSVTLLELLAPTVKTADFANPADLSLTKEVDVANPTLGQNVTFTITVTNGGPGAANHVVVTDVLPVGLAHVSDSASQGSYDEMTGIWTVGSIDGGDFATLQIVATVTSAASQDNGAEVTGVDEFDPDSTPNNNTQGEDDQGTATVDADPVDISVSKVVDNETPDRNDLITFTIEAANDGPDAATNIIITDLLPEGLSLGNVNAPTGTSYNPDNGQWTIDALASGASVTLTLTATATISGAKINTATLTSVDQDDTNDENDSDSVTVTPEVAELAVTKTVDNATPDKNDLITFTIVVNNTGPDTATNVEITDLLPTGLTLGTATPEAGSNYNQMNSEWTIPTLASGASATLTLTATATTSGLKTNTAQVTASDQFDGNNQDDQDSVDVTPQVADLSVAKEVDDATPNAGQTITFTIRVTNHSTTQQATGVTLTDQIPADMTIGTATTVAGTYDQDMGIWNIGTIAANTTVELTITATSTTAAQKTNTARLTTADQFDPDSTPGNTAAGEDDESTITITPNVADVRLSKQVSTSTPELGQQVTFKVTVTNESAQAATGLKVTDQLPSGLTFVSKTAPAGTTYDETTGIWDIPTLAANSSLELTIVATASQVGQVTNKAEVTAMNEFDSDSTPNNNVPTEDDQDSETLTTTQLISPRLCRIVWHRG